MEKRKISFKEFLEEVKKCEYYEEFKKRFGNTEPLEKILERRGILVERNGIKEFVWESEIWVVFDQNVLPQNPEDYKYLKWLRKTFELFGQEMEERGSVGRIERGMYLAYLSYDYLGYPFRLGEDLLAAMEREKIFHLNKGPEDALTAEEFGEAIECLFRRAKKYFVPFLRRAKKRGWIYKNKYGESLFIWNWNDLLEMPSLAELKRRLEEIKEKGAERFLRIEARDSIHEIWWTNNMLSVSIDFLERANAKKILGRNLLLGESLTLDELLEVLNSCKF